MNYKIVSIITAVLLLVACVDSTNKKSNETTDSSKIEHHVHNSENQSIELNQGKKWKVDENMMVHITKMETDIIDFSANEKKDYKSLSQNLQKNINLLTSDCTMKGKAHDELHKWLLPLIDLVDEFSKTKNEDEAEKYFKSIQNEFITFHIYFD